jgi:hypothetical protein
MGAFVPWLVGICVRGRIPQKLSLLRDNMKVAGNTVKGVKFTCFMKERFVPAAEWH